MRGPLRELSWSRLRRVGLLAGSFGVAGTAGLIQTTLLAHLLDIEAFAAVQYALAAAGLAMIASVPGLKPALVQAVARGREGPYRAALRRRLAFSLAGATALAALAAWHATFGEAGLVAPLAAAACLLPPFACLDTFVAVVNGRGQFGLMAAVQSVSSLAVLGTVAGAAILWPSPWLVVVAVCVATIAVNAGAAAGAFRRRPPNDVPDPEALAYGGHLTRVGALSTAAAYADSLIVAALLGPVPLAVYAVAKMCFAVVKQPFYVVYQAIFPSLARRSPSDGLAWTSRVLILVAGGFAISGAFLAALLPWLLPRVFPDAYAGSVGIGQLLVGAAVLAVPGALYEAFLQAVGARKELYRLRFAYPAILLGTLVPFTMVWGLRGTAVAYLVAGATYSLMAAASARRAAAGAAPRAPSAPIAAGAQGGVP